MITNITPLEALKEIFNIADEVCSNDFTTSIRMKEILDIATQALAPQECDVNNKILNYDEEDLFLEFGGTASRYDCERVYREIIKPLQQLQSQQKTTTEKSSDTQNTFTKYEVRDILNGVLLDYLDKPSVDAYRLDVLKKFEKKVK